MSDLIRRADAIDAIECITWYHQNRHKDMVSGANSDEHQAWYKAEDIYDALATVPSADRPSAVDLSSVYSTAYKSGYEKGKADRPQGEWIAVSSYDAFGGSEELWNAHGNPTAFHYCSKCKAQSYVNEFGEELLTDFCPNCGCRMKGADDYERAIEQTEHDMLYEPTYNSEDGSM